MKAKRRMSRQVIAAIRSLAARYTQLAFDHGWDRERGKHFVRFVFKQGVDVKVRGIVTGEISKIIHGDPRAFQGEHLDRSEHGVIRGRTFLFSLR
jgi:hypothetical protein